MTTYKRIESIEKSEKIYFAGALLALAVFSVLSIQTAYFTLPSFDGAMNMQVPDSLVKYGRYATSYNELIDFDPRIQSGAPLLGPIYVLFLTIGKSAFAARMVCVVYLLATAFLIYRFITSHSNGLFGLAGMLSFMAAPRLFEYGLGVFGEIPALFFLLSSLVVLDYWEKKEDGSGSFLPFLVGALVGLSYLTKTVMLIAVPSFFGLVVLDLLFIHRFSYKQYGFMLGGFLLPVAAFEWYKATQIGADFYLDWWKNELKAILSEAGVKKTVSDTEGFLAKLRAHGEKFCRMHRMSTPFMICFLFIPHVVFIVDFLGRFISGARERIRFSLVVLHGTAMTYMVWWFSITCTGRAWSRRILNGYLLQDIAFVLSFYLLWRYFRGNERNTALKAKAARALPAATMTVVVAWRCAIGYPDIPVHFEPTASRSSAETIVKAIRKLPDTARIFGVGWWQAPCLSFLSDRMFLDIRKHELPEYPEKIRDSYLVVAHHGYFIGMKSIQSVLDKAKLTLIARDDPYFLCNIEFFNSSMRPGDAWTPATFVNFAEERYGLVKGIYPSDNTFRWARVDSFIMLKNDFKDSLYLRLYFPTEAGRYSGELILRTRLNGEELKKIRIERTGVFETFVKLPGKHVGDEEILVQLTLNQEIRKSAESRDRRELAFIISRIGFADEK